jgi:hypothetical protein
MSSTATTRRVHLVGSIPGDDTEDALRLVYDTVGERVADWLPDGETGDRYNWIGRIVESLKQHPDLELVSEGDWSDYDKTPVFKVKKGHRFRAVQLDYYDAFAESWPEFQRARAELGRPDLSFQVGIPGPIDIAFASFGFSLVGSIKATRPFEDATVVDVWRIHEVAGDEVVFQLEIPMELEMAARVPSQLRGIVLPRLARQILRLVERSPAGSRWGVHLCVGDMNNKSYSHLDDATPAVLLANALAGAFPASRRLEFVHMPFAHGDIPPATDAAFYAPLGDLDLPDGVRFISGFVHEAQDLETQREVQALIETRLGRPADVAAACGLGRRDRAVATANLEQSKALTDRPQS